ncbi:4-hydroxyphenylpyruvate dioxygenase [Candidatus Bathyarchaeota archaeon]|nr:MAG: 4-hydroxyphenylpyruvate dioxygenase [Candidatus Bathyarchaeota archaeon]
MKADPLPIEGIDYVEVYVGNAKQASYFYQKGFGFAPVAYSGPETGVKDKTSYLMQQGDMRLLLTSALVPDHPIARFVLTHGDGVADIALRVKDVEWTYKEAVKRGAKGIRDPTVLKDNSGYLKGCAISAYGDTVHTFIERDQYRGVFAPGFIPIKGKADPVGLQKVDHVVANVEEGKMEYWVEFYGKVFGFSQLISFDGSTVKFPINEPAPGRRKSQIQEYLDYFKGAGVQHLAIATDDLVSTVSHLQQRGIEFLNTPDSYYDGLTKRVSGMSEKIEDLKKLRILVDRDEKGYMLQIFTKPLQDRPTLFFELIQRKGSESFGKGNFKALFESIEQEQAKRGNL